MRQRPCPLCEGAAEHRGRSRVGDYFACSACGLVHLAREYRLDAAAELAHYRTHRNDPADPGYRAFLDRLAAPLVARLQPGAEGLDFGSGPGPALSLMLAERGFPTRIYDPFFAPDRSALDRGYDFVTCTETVEHFHEPRAEFDRFQRLLRPGGYLALMTGMPDEGTRYDSWWYARDPTHVCFYPASTLRWIARQYGWHLEVPTPDVALFHKPPGATPGHDT
jgi:hypothetical protein